MRSAGNFNSEWGYLAPAPSFMRTVRVVLVATAIGATAGAAVVLSLIDRPSIDHDKTASIAAHAIVTSVQAAPATASSAQNPTSSPAAAALAAPVSVTVAVTPPTPAAPQATTTDTPAPVAPQVVMQPLAAGMPPATTAPQAPPTTVAPPVASAPQAGAATVASQPQAAGAQLQAPVAVTPSAPENSAENAANAAPAAKAASGFASLSDGASAIETAPAETRDQALIPPQTVPPVKKPKPHAAYASNARYQPTPGLGTVLRRLFSPHTGTSYYPNR